MQLLSLTASPEDIFSSGEVIAFNAHASSYLDRVISPNETVERVKSSFERLGITRIADQTGLDKIGIPCFASFRPNAMRLASNQGKGLTKEAARASAVMEAVEFAVAEQPDVTSIMATAGELERQGKHLVDIKFLLPIGQDIEQDKNIHWIAGYDIIHRHETLIPLDALSLNADSNQIAQICKGTNGLASGNIRDEAVFHGLCELIERDANTLWTLKNKKEQRQTAIDPATWKDREVIELIGKVKRAGLNIQLFDQTSDTGIPCVMAVIGETGKQCRRHFDLAAGYGAHPNTDRAAIRAITEAAQSRITAIAGSRDDIDPATYNADAADHHIELLAMPPQPRRAMPQGVALGAHLPNLLAATVFSTMATSNAGSIYVFELNDSKKDRFSVVKVVAPFLEDRDANSNWRPGARALRLMMQA